MIGAENYAREAELTTEVAICEEESKETACKHFQNAEARETTLKLMRTRK
jgi:hypothetical protein